MELKKKKNENKFNLATPFDSILYNIKQQYHNEINCIYIPNKKMKLIYCMIIMLM